MKVLLDDYEKKAARASVVENAMQPIYKAIVLIGVIFILYLGGKNVVGSGWAVWNIATFTTFNLCFAKIADKASKSAKLFNSVEKAKVSWQRILPMINADEIKTQQPFNGGRPFEMDVKDVSFTYENGKTIFKGLSLQLLELLVQRDADDQRQLGGGVELPGLDGADRVPGDAHQLGELRLRQALFLADPGQVIVQYQSVVHITAPRSAA